jgi:membrane-associated protease RseP (regulator of RpoE activity)
MSSAEPPPPAVPWDDDPTGGGDGRGRQFDQVVPPLTELPRLTERDLGTVRRRHVLPAVLLVATLASTFFAGATRWQPAYFLEDLGATRRAIEDNWPSGLAYMAAVMGILLMHEMGHFLQAVRYHIPASWPLFLPVPLIPTGTMGAVIGMEGSRADRRQLFDIGISGPLAGLVLAVPVLALGIHQASVVQVGANLLDQQFADPLIYRLLVEWLRPELGPGLALNKSHPLLMAGWVGMLVTGLNMLPISQLDGGHVIYGLFGARSRVLARTLLVAAIVQIVVSEQYNWSVMLILVILLGVDHPPTRDDRVRLGPLRTLLGLASLAIPVLCFTPIIDR